MANLPENSESSASPPLDPVEALSQIEDDESVAPEAARWTREQMLNGRTPEELTTELIDQGWVAETAEEIVEFVRKETRGERGVITRDDVVRGLNIDYRRATSGLSVAFRSGLFGLYGFTTGFLSALRSARKLKAIREKNRSDLAARSDDDKPDQ